MQEDKELFIPVQDQPLEKAQQANAQADFIEQVLCFAPVTVGVLTLTLLVLKILSLILSTVPPEMTVGSLFVMLALIGQVTKGAYARWCKMRDRHLLTRLLYAFLFGLTWPCWVRFRK